MTPATGLGVLCVLGCFSARHGHYLSFQNIPVSLTVGPLYSIQQCAWLCQTSSYWMLLVPCSDVWCKALDSWFCALHRCHIIGWLDNCVNELLNSICFVLFLVYFVSFISLTVPVCNKWTLGCSLPEYWSEFRRLLFSSGNKCVSQGPFGPCFPLMRSPSILLLHSAHSHAKAAYWAGIEMQNIFLWGLTHRALCVVCTPCLLIGRHKAQNEDQYQLIGLELN